MVITELIDRANQAGLPTVLEVEPAPADQPHSLPSRRIRFYERAGFSIIDRGYVQPPYSPALPAVPLWLMSTNLTISPARVAATLHRKVYDIAEP